MTEPTVRPTLEEQIRRLSRTVEEVRAQLLALRGLLQPRGADLPPHLPDQLRRLAGALAEVEREIEAREQERRNLQAVAELGQLINSSLDLETVLNEAIDTIIRLTGAERAFLMLRSDQGEMDIVVARNWERETLAPEEVEVSRTVIQRVLASEEPVLTTNAKADPRFGDQESIVAYNLRSILCVPLRVKGYLTGVIYADNKVREGLFTERERSLLAAFANQAAVAVENARLFESVRATLDEVTELKNLMEDVFASIASGVITADENDVVTLANGAAAAILGVRRADLVGSSLRVWLPKVDPGLLEKVREVRAADRRYIDLEVEADLPGRGPVTLRLNLTPLKTAGNRTRGVAIVLDDLTERRRLEAQRRLFERMVSPAVIEQLDPDSLHLGGSRAEITTLFADLRGYTAFGAIASPEILMSVLNRYLAVAAEAVLREEGTIDKFQGDAVMAWFNAPLPQPDHTLRAVRAALGIREGVRRLRQDLPPAYHLSFGVGVHFGEALLGLVGTQRRLDYTAIGDSVNTAKRLQERAAQDQILVSRAVVERVRPYVEVRPVLPLEIHGKEEPLEVYELLGLRAG